VDGEGVDVVCLDGHLVFIISSTLYSPERVTSSSVDSIFLSRQQGRKSSTYIHDSIAVPQDRGPDKRHDPVYLGLRGPSVPEEPDGHDHPADDRERQSVLRLHHLPIAILASVFSHPHPPQDLIAHAGEDDLREGKPRPDSEIDQAGDAGTASVGAPVYLGQGGDEEVEVGVVQARVDGEEDDGREDEHLRDARDAAREVRSGWKARSVLGVKGWVSGLLTQTRCLAFEEDRSVGLAEEDEAG